MSISIPQHQILQISSNPYLLGWLGDVAPLLKHRLIHFSPDLTSALTCWAPWGRERSSWSRRRTGSPTTQVGPLGPLFPPRPDHFLQDRFFSIKLQLLGSLILKNLKCWIKYEHRCCQICFGACEGSCCSLSVSGWCRSCPFLSETSLAFHI